MEGEKRKKDLIFFLVSRLVCRIARAWLLPELAGVVCRVHPFSLALVVPLGTCASAAGWQGWPKTWQQ